MNIALVSPYDHAYPGGVGAHITHLYEQFINKGHRAKIIAPCSSTRDIPSNQDVIPIGKPIPIYRRGTVARVTLSPLLSGEVKTILKQQQFEVIHLHEPLCPVLPLVVLDHSQSINVGTFHAFHRSDMGYKYGRPILRRWFHKLNARIAVSEPARNFVSRYFPAHYDIIPNGISLEHFSADVLPIKHFCDGKLNILFVGRLEKRKGLKYLLNAYRQVKKEIPNSRLIVVGPGDKARHEKMARKLNLEDVVFVGYVSYEDLPRYYSTCDLFCAPATGEESFGIVLLEAMAASKPIVASKIEGYASVISNGIEGLLVPPEDEQALADALVHLLSDKSLCQEMGARGRLEVEKYNWSNIARELIDYYASLLHGFGSRT
jgi:phosphatidylinositol alpha-mannosyltransferase